VTPLLSVESVSHRYWRGRRSVQVLTDVSFELEPGEFGGIWGDRGAGKTTIAKIVAGVLVPDSGRIVLDGEHLTDAARRERRGALHAQIGLATRRGPEIGEMPVEEWIASTMLNSHSWRPALQRAHLALERVGASEVGGQSWEHLSDGERMLVSIAHAIVRGPRLLVVDDPVAGLGAAQRGEIMELLHAIAQLGVTVLMTAAELSELQGADRIWSLADGRLDGPPAQPLGTVVPLHDAGRAQSG
jgi:ABC-type multidrug transport system ATPase subunit